MENGYYGFDQRRERWLLRDTRDIRLPMLFCGRKTSENFARFLLVVVTFS